MPNLPPAFSENRLDREARLRTDPDWIAARMADPATRFVQFVGERAAMETDGAGGAAVRWTTHDGLLPLLEGTDPVFLGMDDAGRALFAAQAADPAHEPADPSTKLIDLRSIAVQGLADANGTGILAQARALLHWHARHRFCSNCGAGTHSAEGGYRRHCAACGADHFPRTDPVAIVAVTCADRMLLGRQARFNAGMYSTLAGFVEPGETAEDAARREVFEESGVRVGAVRYVASQPWPFPANLMIGMSGEATTTEIVLDPAELEDARWFDLDEVRRMADGSHPDGLTVPQRISIARFLIDQILEAAVGS